MMVTNPQQSSHLPQGHLVLKKKKKKDFLNKLTITNNKNSSTDLSLFLSTLFFNQKEILLSNAVLLKFECRDKTPIDSDSGVNLKILGF